MVFGVFAASGLIVHFHNKYMCVMYSNIRLEKSAHRDLCDAKISLVFYLIIHISCLLFYHFISFHIIL